MTPESEAAMEALDQKEEPPARSKVDERKERAATEEEERRRKDRLEDRRTASETPASIDGADEASRWRERRRKRQDSESRLGMASDDNQETHDSLERPEKTPGKVCLFVYLLLMCLFGIKTEERGKWCVVLLTHPIIVLLCVQNQHHLKCLLKHIEAVLGEGTPA